jgi:hypothetical protein
MNVCIFLLCDYLLYRVNHFFSYNTCDLKISLATEPINGKMSDATHLQHVGCRNRDTTLLFGLFRAQKKTELQLHMQFIERMNRVKNLSV